MHGEFKVPGGKLVVVDLEVENGLIASFRLAGDFFLEPDGAIDSIIEAFNGMPASSEAAAFAKAITTALPAGALL
ncbi:lipoate protein ligase C-terminal domain-containing protein, partial [Salinibacterium sp.]|uniref:lipoate protein ligase C-terminal domain-containing protein n=1 Tax=Salinibacterium sp. TaxID=1915057 RepID=UPI00286C6C1B